MSKKVIEKKIKEEEEATAFAFQEFIREFQNNSTLQCKTFVRSSILKANTEQELNSLKGTIYNPQPFSKLQTDQTVKNAIECARLVKETKIERIKGQHKPKTNLELLKEELEIRHMQRDEKYKQKDNASVLTGMEVCDGSDLTTTNLFLSNLNPKYTEKDLIQLFGMYGPLASVKIMWPRGEERYRNTNCGFVAFMSRKDGERALENLKNRDDMRVGWGKPLEIPPNPIYVPPELLKLSYPPPYSGLPFNAQPLQTNYKMPTTEQEVDQLLYTSTVKVTIPLDKKLLSLVHRMVEFVVREGPFFEAIIMNREINNPAFQFLFDNKSPVHIYYRWKLYSVLHGENIKNWSKENFRMFKNGPIWIPPVTPDYTQGMPANLINTDFKDDKKQLSDAQATRFNQILQNLDLNKLKIGEAMVFCINHIEAAKDIKYMLTDSFKNINTKATKKIARLNLLSDIMCNTTIKKFRNVYPIEFENELVNIFENLRLTLNSLKNMADKEAFKLRVIKVLRAWSLFKIYSNDTLNKVEYIFLGIPYDNKTEEESDNETDEPLDGASLLKRSMKNYPEQFLNKIATVDNTANASEKKGMPSGFIPSKWETVDPEQVEAQAMSTEKFYYLEMERKLLSTTKEQSKKEREMLRKIELKVMQYQDKIESGKIKLEPNTSVEDEVHKYRKKLLYNSKKENTLRQSSSSEDFSKTPPRKTKRKDHSHKEKERYKRKSHK